MSVPRGNYVIGSMVLGGILAGGWLLFNQPFLSENWKVGLLFTILSLITLVVMLSARKIMQFFGGGYNQADNDLRIGRQVVIGTLGGIILTVLSLSFSLTIGMPVLELSSTGVKNIILIIGAPLIEEPFFLFVVPFFVTAFFVRFGYVDVVINVLLSPSIFASYHYLAYGGTLLVAGAFFGAAVFRFLTMLMLFAVTRQRGFTLNTVAQVIIAAAIMHAIFNAFQIAKLSLVSVT